LIFAVSDLLAVPYRPWVGATSKNDAVLEHAVRHPERFLVSPLSGDPQVLVAQLLTDPRNAAWEVWRGADFIGILSLDRIVPRIDARLQFVFFDDELASKVDLLRNFVQRCFDDAGLRRITYEAPAHLGMLTGFVRRKLKFEHEGAREAGYFDGERWHAVTLLRKFAEVSDGPDYNESSSRRGR
jgi:hypothetical protein